MIANRTAYGATLLELAIQDDRIVIVDSDLSKGLNYGPFIKRYPDRHFDCGIAEQNMVSVAAGLATCGLVPFAASFAVFASMRALDQVRNGVCYNNLNVKVVGTHGGIETGQDGATHQSVEDIAIMRSLPNMKVIVPSTPNMTRYVTRLAAETDGPFYLRFGRDVSEELYHADEAFPIGGSRTLAEGDRATIFACGNMVHLALEAARILKESGTAVRVIDMYSIKPIDTGAIVRAARETGGIVTIEDHSVIGGLGGAVCETVSQYAPAIVRRLGMNDVFGKSGTAADLFRHFNLTAQSIVDAVNAL